MLAISSSSHQRGDVQSDTYRTDWKLMTKIVDLTSPQSLLSSITRDANIVRLFETYWY
jgi:hypothetical protein